MIRLLIGENSFEIDRALGRIVSDFDGEPERIDGSELELRQLPDLLMGMSLFNEKRLVVIKNLSENKPVWVDFSEWLDRLSDDISLVLIEPKPDKRTKTYKDLQKRAEVIEFKPWGERDSGVAQAWAREEATRMGLGLSQPLARVLVDRTGIDQWRVYHALEKLAVLDDVTEIAIREVIDVSPQENVFQLFETALEGDGKKVQEMIQTLALSEDAYRVFGLLASQAVQMTALSLADKPSGEIARDIGAHPFVLSKLTRPVEQLGRPGVRKVVATLAETDISMKSSSVEPWLLIERALLNIAAIR